MRLRRVQGNRLPKEETASAEASEDAAAVVVDAGMAGQKAAMTHVATDAMRSAAKVARKAAMRAETADQSARPNRVSPGRPRVRLPVIRNPLELNPSDLLRDISPFCFPENPFRNTSASRRSRRRRSRFLNNPRLIQLQHLPPRHSQPQRQPSRRMSHSLRARLRLSLSTKSITTNRGPYTKSKSRQLLLR